MGCAQQRVHVVCLFICMKFECLHVLTEPHVHGVVKDGLVVGGCR
jgi:hypothetical protein